MLLLLEIILPTKRKITDDFSGGNFRMALIISFKESKPPSLSLAKDSASVDSRIEKIPSIAIFASSSDRFSKNLSTALFKNAELADNDSA